MVDCGGIGGVLKRRGIDRKGRERQTREASEGSEWVGSGFSRKGPGSVISEYALASYFPHTHAQKPFVIQAGL